MEHLDVEGKDVGDTLTLRVGRRPQLQVVDPVVGPITVAMMDYLVRQERTTEMQRHDQAMLANLVHASNQSTELPGNRYLAITVADLPVAVARPDRAI